VRDSFVIHWRRHSAAAVTVFVLCGVTAQMQNVTEPSLKAAFVYNIALFTEWPQNALPATTGFSICVLGDVPVSDALVRTVKGRLLSGRDISVSRVEVDGALRLCQLLYVSDVTTAQIAAILTAVRDAPVLTISDVDGFARLGGMAYLFVERGRMRFDVNVDPARRSRLQVSSRLLTLAAHIHDEPETAQR
jgi:hypothetical protein